MPTAKASEKSAGGAMVMMAAARAVMMAVRMVVRGAHFAPLRPVLLHVEHHVGVVALGHQAEPAGDFLIGFGLAAEVAAEAVLVELLAGVHVPQAAAVGADLVGEDDAGEIVLPDAGRTRA